MTIENINEDGIQKLCFDYLRENKIQDAFEVVLNDCLTEGCSDIENQYIVEAVLIPSIICIFTEHYNGNDDPNEAFDSFCAAEGICGELQDAVATAINEAAEEDADEMSLDWTKMSGAERIAAVKRFLKRLANAAQEISLNNLNKRSDNKSFLNTHPVKSAGAETIQKEEHTKHPLAATLQKFGYIHSHTHPVVQNDRSTRDYHIWSNKSAHRVGCYSGSEKWTSRRMASGHSFSGEGEDELRNHLKNKQRREKYEEERSFPNIPLLEGLMNTSRISSYTNYMKKHPTLSGFGTDDESNNPRNALKASWRLRDEANKTFDYGKKPGDSTWLDWKSHSSYWKGKK